MVEGRDGTRLILDAGTGIRRVAPTVSSASRVDILLSHLHLDHIQGLGFFGPLYEPGVEVHIWGPGSATLDLRSRLSRYLSPPLFPVHLRDLPCTMRIHEVPDGDFEIGELSVSSAFVCHPGPTVGYRIAGRDGNVAYLPDHEPALGVRDFPLAAEWTSGYDLAAGADLLIHDAQYSADDYPARAGWGHSSVSHALAFAGLAGARHLVLFHHDPKYGDDALDRLVEQAVASTDPSFTVTSGAEAAVFDVGG